MEPNAHRNSMLSRTQVRLLSRKKTYRRHVTVSIFALGLAYFMITAEPIITARAQDIPDTNPGVLPSDQWKFLSTGSPINGITGDILLENVTAVPVRENVQTNCTQPSINDFPPDLFTPEQRKNGALFVHFLVSVYIFYAIALVCDDYFVPAIEALCEAMRLPSDVAGATFMAMATSAPELFTNVISTFVTEGDLGVGTIVGSAVFNILAICSLCGLVAKEPLRLDWWSITRDCSFYSLSVIALLIVLSNRKVFWFEGVVLVALYFVYIIVMYYNSACRAWAERFLYGWNSKNGNPDGRKGETVSSKSLRRDLSDQSLENSEKSPLLADVNVSKSEYGDSIANIVDDSDENEVSAFERDEMLIAKALQQTELHAGEEEAEWGLFRLPFGQGLLKWTEWIVGWPARCVLVVTIPDCRDHRYRKWYPLTFIMCMVWIAMLTYVVAWMMTVIGDTLRIPDTVMGLTFIAAGTSVPEAIASIIVTRQGLGSMGISNSIGSNTFDILICLGLPWLIRASMLAPGHIVIISGGLEYSTILLIASVIVLYFLLACNKFILDKRIGIIALSMYAAFLVISSLFELNVFFDVNLPTCTS